MIKSTLFSVSANFGFAFGCVTGLKDANQIQVQMQPLNLFTTQTHSYLKKQTHLKHVGGAVVCVLHDYRLRPGQRIRHTVLVFVADGLQKHHKAYQKHAGA